MPCGLLCRFFPVAGAEVFFKIGAGLDDWTDTVALSANERATIVDLSHSVVLKPSLEEGADHETETSEEHAEHGSFDPHYFLTVNNAVIIAKTITRELSAEYPTQATVFETNLQQYLVQLSSADMAIKKTLSGLPSRDIVTFHGAWQYFAESYGLTIAGTFEPFPGREPSPRYLAELITAIKQKNISVLFIEPQFSAEAISQVARDLNITLATLDPIGGTTTSTQSYIDLLRTNADTIATALKGN
jgi:zinc transport system substrate-binding protein